MIKTHWYESEPGVISSMRIMAMDAHFAGIIIAFAGLLGFFLKTPGSVEVVAIGAGMTTGTSFAKALQSQSENRIQPVSQIDTKNL